MHVLWLTTVFDDSSVSNILLSLLPHFPPHATFTIVSLQDPKQSHALTQLSTLQKDSLHTIQFECLYCTRMNILAMIRKLKLLIKQLMPDIIHAQLGRAYIVAIMHKLLYSRRYSPPPVYLATFHNTSAYFTRSTSLFLKTMIHHLDAISAVSASALHSIQHTFSTPHTLPSHVIYNPISAPSTPTKTISTDNTTLNLLVVGRLVPKKGHELWVAMLPHLQHMLQHHNMSVQLRCAGHGPLQSTITKLCGQYNIRTLVQMLGYRDDVYTLMQHADIVLCPSQDEGFGLVACEAIMAGTPIVAQDLPVTRELLQDDIWFTDCTDPILFARQCIQVLTHQDAYTTAINNTQAQLQHKYNAPKIASDYYDWYASCIKES